jgi:hypothetical protein
VQLVEAHPELARHGDDHVRDERLVIRVIELIERGADRVVTEAPQLRWAQPKALGAKLPTALRLRVQRLALNQQRAQQHHQARANGSRTRRPELGTNRSSRASKPRRSRNAFTSGSGPRRSDRSSVWLRSRGA